MKKIKAQTIRHTRSLRTTTDRIRAGRKIIDSYGSYEHKELTTNATEVHILPMSESYQQLKIKFKYCSV